MPKAKSLDMAMHIQLTVTQRQRLSELGASHSELNMTFSSAEQRDAFFKERERHHVAQNRSLLDDLLENRHVLRVSDVEDALTDRLEHLGFTRVITPTIITRDMLSKMSIDETHPLIKQVFWIDDKRLLRPMHAPNLYALMGKLRKITRKPVRIFECGTCFRKESKGAMHLNEFTMLNLVELAGVNDGAQGARLAFLARELMDAAGIEDYELVSQQSDVYGETLDIEIEGEEAASGACGPHPLDDNWQITDPWVGFGIGIERLTMLKYDFNNIARVGRGLSYLDGVRLS
jgi:phenylalanyl-tRNA synthetase alpha chain